MKKIILIAAILLCIAAVIAVFIKTRYNYPNMKPMMVEGTTMSLDEAKSRFGSRTFVSKDFREGKIGVRAEMAANLIESKYYIGKSIQDVKADLGDFTGYYWNDFIPAYLITDGKKRSDGTWEDTWQIIFLLGRDRKISEVVIQKNCCDATKK